MPPVRRFPQAGIISGPGGLPGRLLRAFGAGLGVDLLGRVRLAGDSGAGRDGVRAFGAGDLLAFLQLDDVLVEQEGRALLIADFIRQAERQLSPRTGVSVDLDRVLWCVRSRRYLAGLNRAGELLTREVPGDMVAFVAEALPASMMRGVPAGDLAGAGIDEAAVTERADANTQSRFSALAGRIRAADRIPADGWRVSSDTLFQGSALLAPAVLSAFAQRAGGDVLLAAPDRSLVLALPVALPSADRFSMRVLRAWREAMNPVSRAVLVTDGTSVRKVERRADGPRLELLSWLR